MIFEELSHFTKRLIRLMPDDRYAALQFALLANPELGKLIKNSGGLRKVRWALPGRGKSGGVRVIYYWWVAEDRITRSRTFMQRMKKKTSRPMKSKLSEGKSKTSKPGRTYRRLKAAIAEMQAIRRGERSPARAWEIVPDGKGGFIRRLLDPAKIARGKAGAENEAVAARTRLGLSQHTFAALLGVSAGTLRGWEQGRRQPNQAARVLLRVAAKHPEAVLEAAG